MGLTNRKLNKSTIMMFMIDNKALLLMVTMILTSILLTNGLAVSSENIAGIMRQVSVLAIISVGFTLLLASGTIDLSVGQIVSLCGVCFAFMSQIMPVSIAIFIAVILGIVCEFFNGILIRFFSLPGFVLTLAMGLVYKGIAHTVTNGKTIGNLSDPVKFIGQGSIFNFFPMPFFILLVVTFMMAILIGKTVFGRRVLAVGGNELAAKVSGIRITFIKVMAMMIGGVCFAIGSIVLTGRVASAGPTSGDSYMMDAIAAVVIGGTPLNGGKGKVLGTLFGVVLIGVINNMLNLVGVTSYLQWVFKGVIIIVAIILDSSTEKFFAKLKRS